MGEEVTQLKGKRHTPEQIVRKLREADRLQAEGADLDVVCRHLEVSVQTYQRWRAQFKAVRPEDVVRLTWFATIAINTARRALRSRMLVRDAEECVKAALTRFAVWDARVGRGVVAPSC